jgi:vacuolar-type H+-ATPase subunit H
MTDKEFKRLGRAQLIEIIYQLQLELDKVNEEKQVLENKLADKRLRLNNAGNIADAALEINNCFRSAQNAAEQYLDEIKAMREETETECQRILEEAKAEAEAIISGAEKTHGKAILKEFKQEHSDNG